MEIVLYSMNVMNYGWSKVVGTIIMDLGSLHTRTKSHDLVMVRTLDSHPKAVLRGGGDIKVPPTNFSECQNQAGEATHSKKSNFFGPNRKLLPAYPILKKLIALAFLKVTYPQIPYSMHFTPKVQNPIYMYHFHWINEQLTRC